MVMQIGQSGQIGDGLKGPKYEKFGHEILKPWKSPSLTYLLEERINLKPTFDVFSGEIALRACSARAWCFKRMIAAGA